MRCCQSSCLLAVVAAVLLPGCRMPGSEGPVSKSLATCRQLSQQGISAAERGESAEAEQLLSKAVKSCPIDPEARRHYGETLWQRGAQLKAITQLEEATRLAGDDAMLRVRLGQMYLATDQIDRARRSAEQAIDLNPKLSDAWAIRGRVMCADGKFDRALADYHRALGYAPNSSEILLETAELYRRTGQPQRALESLQSLADTYPPGEEPPGVLHLTGLAFEALGRRESGADAFYRLGQTEYLCGRMAEANAAARHALSLQPDHLPSRDLLGRLELAKRPGPSAQGAPLYR